MSRKIKVPYQGEMRDATIVDVNQASELWNHYFLEDGTVLKFKVVVTQVTKIDDEHDQEGNPVYNVKSTNVLTVMCPDELKKKEA